METKELKAVIEGVLFATGDAVSVEKLMEVTECEKEAVLEAAEALDKDYKSKGRGIELARIEDKLQLCTKTELYPYLQKVVKNKKEYQLTDVQLETLSIVAYKQPVTKLQVENIRGVNSDHAVNRLVEYGLVKELGRLDAPGKPILFGTTDDFLRAFGVDSLDDLPEIAPEHVEEFREEAEEEAEERLSVKV
ncbi:MAG: SMC-Scp complex subunit ScpB [Lachnospiraceae bacterium]|nr:SMC-Scp complex subunit ScpB [Lachnospiraceae bacterium]